MRQLNAATQTWIVLVLLGGAVALAIAALQVSQADVGVQLFGPAFWLLLICACIAHAFPVIAPRHQAYHATQAFLLASVLVLTWPAVVLIVIAAHVAEWLRRPRPAHIQLYNIATYSIAAGAAYWLLDVSGIRPFTLDDPRAIVIALLAAAVMLILNHGLTAIVLWLARNIKPTASGLFGLESLGLDGLLLVVGVAIGGGLQLQPLSIVVTGSPLILIYRALRVANVESTSHRDQLTGLYNARHLQEALDVELRRARGGEAHSTGLLVAVLDDIPEIVQRHGRATLDFLVLAVAERLRQVLRDFDQLARIDDASLGVLLPAIDAESLRGIARQASEQVAAQAFGVPTTREPVQVTASAAFATLPAWPGESASELVSHVHSLAIRAALSGPRALSEVRVPPGSGPTGAASSPPGGYVPVVSETAWLPPRQWLRSVQVLTIGMGLALSAWVLVTSRLPDLALVAGILGLVALSELLAFELYDRSSFSVSFAPIVAAGLLGGLGATLVAVWSVAVVRGIVRRSAWDRIAFNASAFTLTGVPALLVASAGGRLQVDVGNLGPLALSTVFASGIYYLHTFLVALAIAMDVGADPRRVWTRNYRWLFPHFVLLGWMGLGLAVATLALGPLGTALFVAPPLAMRVVLKQYVDRTADSVHRLEAANADLRAASQLLRERGEELALLSDLGQLVAAEPLPGLVLKRCVPALGETCALVWQSGSRLQHSVHGVPPVADVLRARSTDELVALAKDVDDGTSQTLTGWALSVGGTWAAAPLRGADQCLGWMLAWSSGRHSDDEQHRRLALMGEVAQRVALVLERDALLQESAELEALRTIDRAKSDFIATTAHELRTPLTSLQGYTELLRGPVEPDLRDRWLAIIHVEAAQLGQVVDQLLDVSRLDSGRFQAERREFDLSDVFERVLEHFSSQAVLSGHTLALDPPRPPPVFADPVQVERVLRNLVSNAIKYSPGGGVIRIVAAETAPREVETCVQDAGLGIPPEWLERIFDRFQRVERPERDAIRGTGLGLYIARQLVELNAGRIWVTSQGLGQGATFHFTLPRAPLR